MTARIRFSFFVIVCAGVWTTSWADSQPPRLRPHQFPLEPTKKAELPIQPETYVEGASEPPEAPPPSDDLHLVRAIASDTQWESSLDLGWFYASQSMAHLFASTGSDGIFTARRLNSNLLSLQGSLQLRPPQASGLGWHSWRASASITSGTADAFAPNTSFELTRFPVLETRGSLGLRLHPIPRTFPLDVALGADLEGSLATTVTLTSAQNQFDFEQRPLVSIVPRVDLHYPPKKNWALEMGFGYAFNLYARGNEDTLGSGFERFTGELKAIRYFTHGNALGLGAAYAHERLKWTRTLPSTLIDQSLTTDLRLHIFWRRDL